MLYTAMQEGVDRIILVFPTVTAAIMNEYLRCIAAWVSPYRLMFK